MTITIIIKDDNGKQIKNDIKEYTHYNATVTSIYDNYASSLVKHPENLDLVNYIQGTKTIDKF